MKSYDRVRLTYSAGASRRAKKKADGKENKSLSKSQGEGRSRSSKPVLVAKTTCGIAPDKGVQREKAQAVNSNECETELRQALKETQDELEKAQSELLDLRKNENDRKCKAWLEGASGKSTVLASKGRAHRLPRQERPTGTEEELETQATECKVEAAKVLAKKDALICELRAQVASLCNKREESLRRQVDHEVSKRVHELGVKHATELSMAVRKVKEKSESTVREFVKKLKPFVARKVVAGFEDLTHAHEQSMQKKLDSKSKQLRSLQSRQSILCKAIESRGEGVSKLTSLCTVLEEKNRDLCISLAAKEKELADLQIQTARRKASMAQREVEIENYADELRKCKSELLQLKSQGDARALEFVEQNKSLHRKLKGAEEALAMKRSELERLTRSMSEANDSKNSLQARERERSEEVVKLKMSLEECTGKNTRLEQNIDTLEARLQKEKEKCSTYMDEARLEIERQNDKGLEMEREIAHLRDSLKAKAEMRNYDEMKKTCEAASLEKRKLSNQLESLQTNLAERQRSLDASLKESQEYKARLSDAKKLTELLKSQASAALKQCEGCIEENTRLKLEISTGKDQSKQKLKQTGIKLQECKRQLNEMQQEKQEMQESNFKTRNELHKSKERVRVIESALKVSSDKNKKLTSSLTKLEAEYSELESKYKNSKVGEERKTESSLKELLALQAELITATKTVIKLKTDAEKKDQYVQSLQEAIEKKTAEAGSFAKEIDHLKRQKTEMRSHIAYMKNKKQENKTPESSKALHRGSSNGDRRVGSPSDSIGTKQDDFERIILRLKRINKKFKLKLASVIKHAEGKQEEESKKAALVQLIHTTLTSLDRAPEQNMYTDYSITLSGGVHGILPRDDTEDCMKCTTPEQLCIEDNYYTSSPEAKVASILKVLK